MNIFAAPENRRNFLINSGGLIGLAALSGPATLLGCSPIEKKTTEVTATEDLMREHGVLRRLLLIYDDLEVRLQQGREFFPQVLTDAAGLIRRFIEDYHEILEEEHVFPRFEKAEKMAGLVKILRRQHEAGRKITASLLSRTAAAGTGDRQKLAADLRAFARMYRPHAAREDTVLFPALRGVIAPGEFNGMGDEFEDIEKKKFGKGGYEKIVAQVAGLEKALGIEDLSQFTPQI
jgi:hemerythrin-like domain-containing protein